MRKSAKMGHRRETKTASTSHTPITAGFLLMLWTLNFVPTTEAIDSTCNLSQYGSSGNLVCEFSEDIGKHSFGVLWYPRGIKNKTGHGWYIFSNFCGTTQQLCMSLKNAHYLTLLRSAKKGRMSNLAYTTDAQTTKTILFFKYTDNKIRQSLGNWRILYQNSNVVLLYSIMTGVLSEIILDCTWLQHGLDCTRSSENFQFDNKVSNSITLKISELDGNNDGRYECVLIPTNGGEYSPCYYSYKDGTDQNTPSKHPEQSTTTLPPPDNPGNNEKESTSDNDFKYMTVIIVVMSVVITALVLLVLVICILIQRRRHHRHMVPTTEPNPEHEQQQENGTACKNIMLQFAPWVVSCFKREPGHEQGERNDDNRQISSPEIC